MLEPWLKINSNYLYVKNISKKFEFDFIYFGCNATQSEILKTSIAQPLIFITSLLSFRSLNINQNLIHNIIFLGHSVGEIAALVVGDYLSPENGIELVIARGKYMEKSTFENKPTGMMAVICDNIESVESKIEEFNLTIANYNGNNQVVLAGYKEDLLKYKNINEHGVKKILLDVQGAFHSKFMLSSEENFRKLIESMQINYTKSNFISNFDGKLANSEKDIKTKLANQIVSPVRWDLCMKYLNDNKIDSIIELSPSGVLSNLIKRDYPQIIRFALNHENIKEAKEFFKERV